MYAIVEIAGQQFKVEAGKNIFVHRLDAEEGKKIEFENVLLIEDEGKITIGEPVIKGAVVEGIIADHMRGEKVIVFKKKRKKGYRIKNGHRQNFTEVEILSINGKGSPEKAAAKKVKADTAESVAAEEPAKAKKPAAKKAPAQKEKAETKKAEAKKPAGKKPAAKKAAKSK